MIKEAPGCGKQDLAGSFGGRLEDLKAEENVDKGDWVDEVSELKRALLRIGLASCPLTLHSVKDYLHSVFALKFE